MSTHEFGIMDSFEENKWYSAYEPQKYNCISVNDVIIEDLIIRFDKELRAIKTYHIVSTQVGKGLDYTGVTIIPPESLNQFRDVLSKANSRYQSPELQALLEMLTEAIKLGKHLIHYGI